MQSYSFTVSAIQNSIYSITALPKHRFVQIESGRETLVRLPTDNTINYFYKITNPSAIKHLELQITQRHFTSEESLRKMVSFGFKTHEGLLLEGKEHRLTADEIDEP